jgi:hypothetical protein
MVNTYRRRVAALETQTVLTDQRRCKFGHALDLQVTVLQ